MRVRPVDLSNRTVLQQGQPLGLGILLVPPREGGGSSPRFYLHDHTDTVCSAAAWQPRPPCMSSTAATRQSQESPPTGAKQHAEQRERQRALAPLQYASPGSAAAGQAARGGGAAGERGDAKRCVARAWSTSSEPTLCRLPKPGSGSELAWKKAGVAGMLPASCSASCARGGGRTGY
jgi:hypothetical protein